MHGGRARRSNRRKLFRVLGTVVPDVLIALRDGPHDRASTEQWARTHWLNSPLVIQEAERVVEWWRTRPKSARLLDGGQITMVGIHSDAPGEKEWRRAMLCAETLPQPHLETLKEWLTRATEVYHAIDRIQRPRGGKHVRKVLPVPPSYRDIEWFVEVQVRDRRAKEAGPGVARSQVTRARSAVATLLGIPPRPSRLGVKDQRPRKPRADAK